MGVGPLVVTYPLSGRSRAIVEEELDGVAEAVYLVDLLPAARAHALERAGAVLSHDISKELRPDEIPLIRNARLLQFTAAGVDWVPTRDLPWELPVAANKGGGAEPMSEHIVALALAAAKRLFIEHAHLKSGEFHQGSANRILRGGVCGILGFGNVGVATARHNRRALDCAARRPADGAGGCLPALYDRFLRREFRRLLRRALRNCACCQTGWSRPDRRDPDRHGIRPSARVRLCDATGGRRVESG